MARRKFTREFKVSAVKLVNEQGYTIPAAAKSLGVDPNCVRGWVAKLSAEPGMAVSMSGVGQCWDNAAMESFWATLKTELVHHERYATRGQARASIFEYLCGR